MKKLIIFSRHGLRYPLLKYETMSGIISKEDINWDFDEGGKKRGGRSSKI